LDLSGALFLFLLVNFYTNGFKFVLLPLLIIISYIFEIGILFFARPIWRKAPLLKLGALSPIGSILMVLILFSGGDVGKNNSE
jgi:hypothetical protein